jgi:hypothetical protein
VEGSNEVGAGIGDGVGDGIDVGDGMDVACGAGVAVVLVLEFVQSVVFKRSGRGVV